jgi:endonuclease/exonuclease/phosphatase family metal-dependent hydrolase
MLRAAIASAVAAAALVAVPSPAMAATDWVKVGTYNIRKNIIRCTDPLLAGERPWQDRKAGVIRHILDPNLDGNRGDALQVVGIQEARDFPTCGTQQPVWQDLRVSLQAASGQPWAVADARENTGYNYILFNSAAYTAEAAGTWQFPIQAPRDFERTLSWATFRQNATGKRFFFSTTHITPVSSCLGKKQWKQMIAFDKAASGGLPIIATGDFNITRYDTGGADCRAAKLIVKMRKLGIGDVMVQKLGSNGQGTPVRAATTFQKWVGSSNGFRPLTKKWAYPGAPNKIGRAMIDLIFASNHLPVAIWGTSADLTPDGRAIEGGFPSDHNLIFAEVGLP